MSELAQLTSESILKTAPVVPVIALPHVSQAVPMANALLAGGIPVLEVTLRTPAGLDAIREIRSAFPDIIIGAGTVTTLKELALALKAGSQFIISPGLTPALLAEGSQCGVPFMPGVATVSELMCCLDAGLETVKFFPAEAAGGAAMLKAISGPFPQVKFCPTGGIGLKNMASYLSLDNVLSVGGSWLTPTDALAQGDWASITQLAVEAVAAVEQIKRGSTL